MKKILINDNPWQTRIAITRDDKLCNLYFASHAKHPLERSFFKGVVSKVLPGIQTAFVDFGQERAGFLHISEIDRELAFDRMKVPGDDDQLETLDETAKPKRQGRPDDISKILREGEEILVQVSKEPVYTKGAKLTTCFTIPGRFFVLMPNIARIAISKKISNREERTRLKELIRSNLPEGMGAIIRTTCDGRQASEILSDLTYLVNTWNDIQTRYESAEQLDKVHEDAPLAMQVVRDHLDDDVESVITDTKESQNKLYSFIKEIAPDQTGKVVFYKEPPMLFDAFDIDKQIQRALEPKVHLNCGGTIIVEPTEAMTVIDVNTAKFTGKGSMEETIFKTNMEASEEVVRQLSLRNVGGLIVIDFIDMSSSSNKQKLIQHLEKNLREYDKFQSVVLKISEFGLVQMTRKRSGKTLMQQITETCRSCKGLGVVSSVFTESHRILRELKRTLLSNRTGDTVTLQINKELFEYLNSELYNSILELEKNHSCVVILHQDTSLSRAQHSIEQR
jgi:ribonuclease G